MSHDIKLAMTVSFFTAMVSVIWPTYVGIFPTLISPALLHGGLFSLFPFLTPVVPLILTAVAWGAGFALLIGGLIGLTTEATIYRETTSQDTHHQPDNPNAACQFKDDQPPSYSEAIQHKGEQHKQSKESDMTIASCQV